MEQADVENCIRELYTNQARTTENLASCSKSTDTLAKCVDKLENKMQLLSDSFQKMAQTKSYFMGAIGMFGILSGFFGWEMQNIINNFEIWNKNQDVQIHTLQEAIKN